MPQRQPNLLFVYGSLMSEVAATGDNRFSLQPPESFTQRAIYWGEAQLRGKLYLVEGRSPFQYPGLELDYNGREIRVDVFNIPSSEIFEDLDRWEKAVVRGDGRTREEDTHHPYVRRIVTAMSEGQTVTGWVYEGSHHWTQRRYIPHSRWAEYTREAAGGGQLAK